MLGMLTFRLCLLSKPVSPEFAWKPNAKIIQKFRNRRRCGQISTDGRRNRLLHGPADDRCSCNRGGEGPRRARRFPSSRRTGGADGEGALSVRSGERPESSEGGVRNRFVQTGSSRSRPPDMRGIFREGRGVASWPLRGAPSGIRTALRRPEGGRGRSKPLPALPVHLRAGRRGGGRKTFCGSAPAAENACGIRRNVRGEAACGTRPAELERAPGRNRGRAGSGAGNNSAGICAFYRRNFVSLSGS